MSVKVLHLISGGDIGGAADHVFSLLSRLGGLCDAQLLTLGDGPLTRRARLAGLDCAASGPGFFSGLQETRRLVRETGCDLCHCHGTRANVTGALLKPSLGVPVISTVHSDHTLDYLGRPAAGLLLGGADGLALRRMDALVCVSRAMSEVYDPRGFGPVYPIFNGVAMDAPRSPRNRGDDLILVGTAVRFSPVKDLPTLLRAFALSAASEPRLRLALAGAGPEEAAVRSLIRKLGIADRVRLPGWITDTESLYDSLDIVALSSLSETFPYALGMAARYSLPVVSTDVGGVAELTGADGGLLVPAGDSEALGRAISSLAADKALRARVGDALSRRYREHFTTEAMAERQAEIYRAVLAAPRRTRRL